MNFKTIDSFNNKIYNTKDKLYLCMWNDGDIVEIHTLKSLIETYNDIKTNYENNDKLSYSNKTWKEIFKLLDNYFMNEIGLNIDYHIEDNMEIQRIK